LKISTKRTMPLRAVAASAGLVLVAAVALVACDMDDACAATVPRPAPAPRVPSFSKPSTPRTAPVRPPAPRTGGHSTTVVPVPVYVHGSHC
jgi:hypothetical protein